MPTFASQRLAHATTMLQKYEDMLESAGGLQTVNVDGQQVSYEDLEAKRNHWAREAARLHGIRPAAASIDLRRLS